MRFLRLVCLGFLAIVITVGCGPKGPAKGDVQGKVTFKGQPVTEGSINFVNPKEGGTAGGDLNKDGTYEVKGVLVGEYLVIISPPMVMMDTDPGKSPPAPVEKNVPNIPQKYRQQGNTPFKATVKQGKNDFDFDMKP